MWNTPPSPIFDVHLTQFRVKSESIRITLSDLDPQQVDRRGKRHFQPCFPPSRSVNRPVFLLGFRETPHPSSVTDGMDSSNTLSVKTHPLRMGLYQIPHHPYRIGICGQNPPSVIRSGCYRKMGLGIRGRTDRDGDPKTDQDPCEEL